MATLTLRVLAGTLGTHTTKGSPLTHAEMDTNWLNLDAEMHSSMADITLLQADVAQLQLTAPTTGTVAPTTFTAGSLWLDTSTDTLYCYNGSAWVNVGEDMPTAPSANPSPGDTYFDDTANVMYVYDGAAWGPLGGGAKVSAVDPGATNPGELWFDTTVGQLKVWDGAVWSTTANTVSYGNALPAITGLEQSGDYLLMTVDGTPATEVTVAYVFDGTQWKRIAGGAVTYSGVAPTGAGGVGDEWYVTTDGTRTGLLLAAYVYDGTNWTQTNSVVAIDYGTAVPTVAGTENAGDVYIQTDDGSATGVVQAQYLFDGTQWSKVSNGAISYGSTVPAGTAAVGDVYLRTSDGTRTGTVISSYVFDGTGWVQTDAGAGGNGSDGQAGPAAPTTRSDSVTGLVDGDIWYDTTNNKLMVYEGGVFVPVAADAIGDLSDVNTTGVVNGNSLVYNGTNWVPGSAVAGSVPTGPTGGRPTGPALGDVFYNTTTGELEVWDGGAWSSVNNDVISDNDDVDTTGVVLGNSLVWNGTIWVPGSATANAIPSGPANPSLGTEAAGDVFYNTTTGELMVHNGTTWESSNVDVISDLDDVDTTGLLAGDHLVYDGANWVPETPSTNITVPSGPTGSEPTTPAAGDMYYDTTTGEMMVYDGGWKSVNVDVISDLDDVNTTGTPPTDGQSLIWDNTNSEWVPGDVKATVVNGATGSEPAGAAAGDLFFNTTENKLYVSDGAGNWAPTEGDEAIPTGPTGSEPASPVQGDLYFDTTTSKIMVYNGGVWTAASASVNDGTLTLNIGVAGATGTTVTVASGTGFSADVAANQTYSLSVGPALTEVATELAAGKSATGLLTVSAVDTLTQLADGTVSGQVLTTDAAGTLSWTTPATANDGTLTLNVGAAGATGSSVTVGTGTGFSANVLANQTYSLSVGPAITDYATKLSGAVTGTGLLQKTAADTIVEIADSTAGYVLSTDGLGTLSWVANPNTTNTALAFDIATGVVTLTDSDTNTVTVDIDGRYIQTVNGSAGDASGNVVVSLVGVAVGTLAARPAAGTSDGDVYVVTGDTDPTQDGKTFIWSATTSQWYQVTGYDQASLDARYVNHTDSIGALADVTVTPNSGDILQYNGTAWVNINPNTLTLGSIDLHSDVDTSTAAPTAGQALVWNGANWVPGTGASDGTLTLAMGASGATGSAVTVATGTGFSANTATNATYSLSVGPAITDYATKLSGAVTATGLLQKTAADTVTELADGTVSGQVLTTDAAGALSWTTPSAVNAGTLTLNVGAAGATNTSVTVATGTGFDANTATNATYSLSVGPAITDYATKLSGAPTGSGLFQKTAADTIVEVADGTSGQVLSTDGAGNLSWASAGAVNDGTLTLNVGAAGATASTVTVATGTGFSANTATNATYALSVGPALTDYATKLANGKTASGLYQVSAADTITELADGTTGQVLTTDGAGALSWTTPAVETISYNAQDPVTAAATGMLAGDEWFVTSDGTATGTITAQYIYDAVNTTWVLRPSGSAGVAVTYSAAAPAVNGVAVGDEHYKTSDGTRTGVIHQRYLWDGTGWMTDIVTDGSPDGGATDDF